MKLAYSLGGPSPKTAMFLSLALAVTLGHAKPMNTPDPLTTIWMTAPAEAFTASSVLGNGRLGAMVFGKVGQERVVLNESTLWSGSPQEADRPDAHTVLPKIRQLLLAGDNAEANDLAQSAFTCAGKGSDGPAYGCYQTFGDLLITAKEGRPEEYRRVLDLDRAVATVTYKLNGIEFQREAFTSAPQNVFVYRYRASQSGQITFDARLQRPENATTKTEGQDFVLEGQLDSGNPAYPGLRFAGRLRVVAQGGTIHTDEKGIHVENADAATLFFTAGTDMFDPNFQATAKAHLDAAAPKSFEALEREHVHDYQRFFHRVTLRLPEGSGAHLPTPQRMESATHGHEDPSLAALYFNFGRYLTISGSRPDSPLPTNLQGIWAEELHTPWNGDFHLDINVQMNYWHAETTNLSDCVQPLLRFIESLTPNGQKTAMAYYGAGGWVAHTITNPWHYTSPGEGAGWGLNDTGGAWLCAHLWDHYAFTGDKTYLRSAYPTLKGAAEFFLDSLFEEPSHHWLVTGPANSSENSYIDPKTGKHLAVCMGPTMDSVIIHQLFTHVIQAAEALGIDPEFRAKVEAARARLVPLRIGKYGQLMEWLQDYEEAEPHHRHTSHLYALYPDDQISPDRTPDLARAARTTLERRGDEGVGWSLAWKICLHARLFEGDKAWQFVKALLKPVTDTSIRYDGGGGAYANLLDACPPFQIDGNFGATAGIAEMLMQSRDGKILLLPALPAAWPSGSVTGLKARGNLTVDIEWKNGKVTHYKVTGPNSENIKVIQPTSN